MTERPHDWHPIERETTPWEECRHCGQQRQRVPVGWKVRVYVEGRERQLQLPADEQTACSPFLRIRGA